MPRVLLTQALCCSSCRDTNRLSHGRKLPAEQSPTPILSANCQPVISNGHIGPDAHRRDTSSSPGCLPEPEGEATVVSMRLYVSTVVCIIHFRVKKNWLCSASGVSLCSSAQMGAWVTVHLYGTCMVHVSVCDFVVPVSLHFCQASSQRWRAHWARQEYSHYIHTFAQADGKTDDPRSSHSWPSIFISWLLAHRLPMPITSPWVPWQGESCRRTQVFGKQNRHEKGSKWEWTQEKAVKTKKENIGTR